jgi:ABC-type transport system substrate-binding protein
MCRAILSYFRQVIEGGRSCGRSLHNRRAGALVGSIAALALLAACGTDNDSAVRVSVIDTSASVNIDAVRLTPLASKLRAATSQGLVRFDANGEIIPALAERWIVTSDGQSFIFRLREAQWQNGDRVTTEQVAAALRRRLSLERRTRLGPDLSEIRDIRAMTKQVIEIRLDAPKPDLLRILAQPEMGVRRSGNGTGPMRAEQLEDWTALASRPDETDDSPSRINERPLFVRREDAARAIARFLTGHAEIVMGGRFEHLPLLGVAAVDSNAVRLDPVSGLFGLIVVENTGLLSSSANRGAIAMAIDRSRLMGGLNIGGWQPSTRLVATGVDEYGAIQNERWADISLEERQIIARERIDRWVAGNGPPRTLNIAMPDGPGSDLVFARIKADLATIGLNVNRVTLNANADLRLIDEIATYNKATWYLNQLSCHLRRVCDEEGDDILTEAKRAIDPEVRKQKLAEAEASMTIANYYIPFGAPVRWSLVKPGLSGFNLTDTGRHPLPEIAQIPR